MNEQRAPIQTYELNVSEYERQVLVLKRKRSVIAWIRLLIALLAIIVIKLIWHTELWIIICSIVAAIACFLYVVSIDTDAKEKMQNLERLIAINKEEIDILNGDFLGREDGRQLEIPHHPYAQDLDIFGTASLYQYISRCTAAQSKQLLANALLQPAGKENILLKQDAVKELAAKINWRQQLQSSGMEKPVTIATETKIKNWLQAPPVFNSKFWKWLGYIFPVISLTTIFLYLNDNITPQVFYLLAFCFLIFAFSLSKKIHTT